MGGPTAASASEPATSSFESKLSTHIRLAAKERATKIAVDLNESDMCIDFLPRPE